MKIGKVIGSVWATRKAQCLQGQRFLVVDTGREDLVAADQVGAGIGEYVLVAQGSAARIGCGVETAPVDAAIVGIIDDGAGLE